MAVGMTLHQLYAPPSYAEQPAGGPAPSAASATSSPAASSASASSAPASSSAADPTAPPAGRAYAKQPPPMAGHAAKTSSPYAYPPPAMVSSAGYAAYPPPSAYPPSAVYPPKADEGYVADPLPFEYAGMRRFHPAAKDYADVVYASAAAAGHGGAPVYTATSVAADRGVYQAYDPRPQYAAELPAHYPPRSVAPYAALPLTHAFPPLLDAAHPSGLGPTKKEVVDAYAPSAAAYGAAAEPRANAGVPAPQGAGGAAQEAMIKVKTPLKLKYWRNGRRNLQCFPSCKVFGDYSAIKIEDLKQHDFMWGKCRGSIVTEVTLNSNVSLDDLVLLGRVHSLENIPVAFEEAVIRECMLGRMVEPDVMDAMKDQWITGERLPDFVQQDANVACFEFKPKVWKYTEDMAQGKCKRRNVKYYVQFEAFVLVLSGDRRYYACIGSGMSTSFEVGSSRVLARQKRKAASNGASLAAAAAAASQDKQQQQQLVANDMAAAMQPMHHHPAMLPPNMMPTHPMAGAVPMYQPYPAGRSLPPTFPHPQLMAGLPPQPLHDAPQLHQPAVDVHQQQQQQQQQPSVGSKRKMSSERPAFPTDRAAKALKTASM